MRLTTNLIICAFSVQFAIGCSASFSEQCRQITAITKKDNISEIKEPIGSKRSELLAKAFKQSSQEISQLSISDSSLKSIQQRMIKNYNDLAENKITQSNFSKQSESFMASSSPSVDEINKALVLSDQSVENLKQSMILGAKIEPINNELKAICSAR